MAGLIAALLLVAQAFDVASIKVSPGLETGGSMRLMPDGGITARHMPARSLLTVAYQIQQYQLIDAPEWTRTAYYDVVAKPVAATPPSKPPSFGPSAKRDDIWPMMQALLAERFKLSVHREKREVDGYVLVRVRAGELGPGFKPSAVDCEKAFATTPRCREGGIDFGSASNSMKRVGIPMWSLLQTIIGQVASPVRDETQLTGTYDVNLRWSTELAPSDDLPVFVTALQEQLGLKLEKRKVTTEVVIVDHIERPSPD